MTDFDDKKTPRRLWIIAALVALGLHVGGAALALAHLGGDTDDEGLGSNGVEIALDMESPKVPDDDLPVGPDSQAHAYSPEIPEQKTEVKEADFPKAIPDQLDEADRVVTTNDVKKPKEEEAKVAAVQTQASDPSPQTEDTSRKSLEDSTVESDQAKAPNAGIGKDRQKLTANWGRKISAYFELHKRYPAGKNKSAKVGLNIVLNRRGNVVSAAVARSSGDPSFDEAAISMIHRSDPVPAPPAGLTEDQFAFSLDVVFNAPK